MSYAVVVGLVLAAGCGASSPPASTAPTRTNAEPTPTGPPPMLLARPVWDGPLSDPMALRALERVGTVLDDKPPILEGADPRMWLGPLQGWIERRVKLTREVRADAEALATDADPRMQLLATVVISVATDDFVTDLLSVEPPPEFVAGEHGAETRDVFRSTVEEQALPLAASARETLQKCIATAPRAPAPLRVWEAFCRERDTSLHELEARVKARAAATPAKQP